MFHGSLTLAWTFSLSPRTDVRFIHSTSSGLSSYLEDDFRAALGTERAREQRAPLRASQCSSRIHYRRARGRYVAGAERNDDEYHWNKGERCGVGGGHAKKQARRHAGQGECCRDTQRDAGDGQCQALADNQSQDAPLTSAGRHPNRKLSRSLRNAKRHHAVDTNCGEEQCHRAEARNQPRRARCRATESSTSFPSVVTRETGCVGSIASTSLLTVAVSSAGSVAVRTTSRTDPDGCCQ